MNELERLRSQAAQDYLHPEVKADIERRIAEIILALSEEASE